MVEVALAETRALCDIQASWAELVALTPPPPAAVSVTSRPLTLAIFLGHELQRTPEVPW